MKILITGGASGLGEAITRRLAVNSADSVYFTYNKSQEKAEALTKRFSNITAIKCDFSNEDDTSALVKKIETIDIDVLINNAYQGSFIQSHFHKTPPSHFADDFRINILPTITITQAALICLRKKKSGKIITVLSSALLTAPPAGTSIYVADKAYLKQLVTVWANENAKFNITSNSISPSFMQTGLTKNIDERIIDQIREKHPSGKLLTVDEAADAVKLMVDASFRENGVDITVGPVIPG